MGNTHHMYMYMYMHAQGNYVHTCKLMFVAKPHYHTHLIIYLQWDFYLDPNKDSILAQD